MTEWLYHGSITPGITTLEVRSRLHGTDKRVVYLTDSIPYALFYIWDSAHNGLRAKYVTGGFRGGQAFYEEQFPDQLRTLYEGVSGWLYRIPFTADTHPVEGREGLFYREGSANVGEAVFIPDVYAELLKYEAANELRILRYSDHTAERKAELTTMLAEGIRRSGYFENDPEQKAFMQRHFPQAWGLRPFFRD